MTLEALAAPDDIAETTANTLAAIGGRIRELRLARGLTLQSLADSARLSPSMLSLVERGRASPSIGSLIVVANALNVSMADLVASGEEPEEKIVVHAHEAIAVETAQHVVRRLLRDDRARGISIALNEYAPHTGSTEKPIFHEGFEYGFILEGELTVEVSGVAYALKKHDLIAYSSTRLHKMWNHGSAPVKTLWFNLERE